MSDLLGHAGTALEIVQSLGVDASVPSVLKILGCWAFTEVVRRSSWFAGQKSCSVAKAIYAWATAEKPLSEEEQALYVELKRGIYDPKADALSSRDGQTEACLDGRTLIVTVGEQDVAGVLS